MKTADQIEPRTPISSAPYTITNPGSYYLTTNLIVYNTNGITISASCVTLDLNGFAIIPGVFEMGANGNYTAILISTNSSISLSQITILNGSIYGDYAYPGFWDGIYSPMLTWDPGFNRGIILRRVSIGNVWNDAINLGKYGDSFVDSCYVTGGHSGITAGTVVNSTVNHTGSVSISARIANCCDLGGGSRDIDHAYNMP